MHKLVFCLMFVTILFSLIEAENVQKDFFDPTALPSDHKENCEFIFNDEENITDPDSRLYCPSTYTNQTDDYISNVSLNTWSNASGQDGPISYGDYTSIVFEISSGVSHGFSVTFVSNGYTQHVWAWIDWNHDDVFDNTEDSNERYDLGDGIDTTLGTTVIIPEGAHPGTTRMRIIEQYNTDPGPCDTHENIYGETEDYTIDVRIYQNAWTGAVDNNWHNIDNWLYHFVPDATTLVSIPNVANKCWIYAEPAYCNFISVGNGSGNDLRIYDEVLVVSDNMSISGQLLMDHVDGKIIVNGDLIWGSGSRASIQANTTIDVYGDCEFYTGANVTINNGSVNMIGSNYSTIEARAGSCYFNNLNIDKSSNGSVQMGWFSTDIIHIQGDLIIDEGVLNVVENTNLRIDGNIVIEFEACLDTNSGSEIEIGGNWTNENFSNTSTTGYWKGGESVIFNGEGDQFLTTNASKETFGNIIIDKTSGEFKPNNNILDDGALIIQNGSWRDNVSWLNHEFVGHVLIDASGGFFPLGSIAFLGYNFQTYQNDGVQALDCEIIIDKEGTLSLNTDMILPDNRALYLNEGILDLNGNTFTAMDIFINEGGEVRVDEGAVLSYFDGILVGFGGILTTSGVSGNNAIIRKESSGFSVLEVYAGGTISASYTDFTGTYFEGVWVHDDANVDPVNCFNNCNFIDGINNSSSARLRIDNDQTLNISNINFNNNPYLADAYNISKTINQGELNITTTGGDFTGPLYENDPHGRVEWSVGLPEVNDLTIHYNSLIGEIELNWTYPGTVDQFRIYRSIDPHNFSSATVFTTTTTGYSEPAVGTKYFYRVTARNFTDDDFIGKD